MSNTSSRLADARARIDELDEQIIAILAERMSVCASIAETKSDEGIPMMQPNRVDEVRERYVALGTERGLSQEFAKAVHACITREACRLEDEILGNTPKSQIIAIDHVAVAVPDLEAAVTELVEKYGMTVIERRSVDGKHSGMTSATLRANQATFVVCQGTSPASNVSQYVANRGPGIQHVALSVADHEAHQADLRKAGAELLTGIIHAPGLDQSFTRRSSTTGLQLEFVSRSEEHTGFEDDSVRELFESMERENVW
jgi:chorismate mutase/catechol 2,3-dioxygenase-like lactoylglutathione lyase family enzyme